MKTAILISTFNRRLFLEYAIKNILKTQGDYDVYVLDDGSTDGTKEMMEDYKDRVKYIHFEKNRGLRWILNYGLQKLTRANYDYISYSQDDVVFDPHWLELCIRAWKRIPKIGFITCHDAPEHPTTDLATSIGKSKAIFKPSCRATHLFASTERWKMFGEIPDLTPGIAAPKMGVGSKVDWWLMGHDDYPESKHSLRKGGEKVLVLPGKCLHLAYRPGHSTWGNLNPENWVLKNNTFPK